MGSSGDRLCQTSPIPRSPDGNDKCIKVGRWEAGDQEWRAEIERGFQGSGLVPGHFVTITTFLGLFPNTHHHHHHHYNAIHWWIYSEHMPDYPSGLVNLNFGMHGCIHLGTQLPAQVNIWRRIIVYLEQDDRRCCLW